MTKAVLLRVGIDSGRALEFTGSNFRIAVISNRQFIIPLNSIMPSPHTTKSQYATHITHIANY